MLQGMSPSLRPGTKDHPLSPEPAEAERRKAWPWPGRYAFVDPLRRRGLHAASGIGAVAPGSGPRICAFALEPARTAGPRIRPGLPHVN
jgi:hypothetical protein